MSVGALVTAAAALVGELAKLVREAPTVKIPATRNGKGLNGIAFVKAWPGGWKREKHMANIYAAIAAGNLRPWRWCPLRVHDRLVVAVADMPLAIGDGPPAYIPCNASNAQRIFDLLGRQLGRALIFPTPKIVDVVHLAAVKGAGRALELTTIWGKLPPVEPNAPGLNRPDNVGQSPAQWLRNLERTHAAVMAAGGYPSSGVLSSLGKDGVTAPQLAERAKPGDAGGESKGAKLLIYGGHVRGDGNAPPQLGAPLISAGWKGIMQTESAKHVDADDGTAASGGFWDYSQTWRPVLDDCQLDGAPAKLSTIYATAPELVYVFAPGAARKAIASRYPLVPASVV